MVESTEDLQVCFEKFNTLPKAERNELIAFSMDAQALYPSIDVEISGEVIFELLVESEVVYENIDILELSRYVAAAVKEDVVLKHGLNDFVMRRKYKKGPRPTVCAYNMGFLVEE